MTGPAFPTTPENETRLNGSGGVGLSKREFFTAHILVGIISGRNLTVQKLHADELVDLAVELSDAALKRLARSTK